MKHYEEHEPIFEPNQQREQHSSTEHNQFPPMSLPLEHLHQMLGYTFLRRDSNHDKELNSELAGKRFSSRNLIPFQVEAP